jgi:hypothetical protein
MNRSLQAVHVDRTCLLILGMHRSGTSAITRVLNLMGAELPKQMVGAKLGNESGHWEPEQLVLLHDQMLTEVGSSWRDLRPLDLAQLSGDRLAHFKLNIQSIIQKEFGSASVFVLKDPRICRFLGVYKTALTELDVRVQPIIIIRNPLEVAASLSARDNISSAHGLLLWLRHCLDVEKHTRNMRRVFVSYDTVVNHPRNLITRLRELLGEYLPESPNSFEINSLVLQFIRRDLRHQAVSPADMDHNLLTKTWISAAFRSLSALLIDEDDNTATTTLDRISIEFDNVVPFLAQLADDADVLRIKEQQLQDDSRSLQKSVEQLGQQTQRDAEQRIHDLQRNAEQYAHDLQRNAEQHTQNLQRITEQYARELAELRRIDYNKRLPPELKGFMQWLSSWSRKRRRLVQDYHKIAASPLFDKDWYLQNNPDIAAANVNPALHYLQHGGREGRAPGPHFKAYMKATPDVVALGANPLLHFLETYRTADDVSNL